MTLKLSSERQHGVKAGSSMADRSLLNRVALCGKRATRRLHETAGPRSMTTTFPQLLLHHAAQRSSAPAMREKEYGIWQTHSWGDMARLVEQVACGLHEAGLRRGEHMVVIGANRPRLYAANAGGAGARLHPGAAVSGRSGGRNGVPHSKRRCALCVGGGPGAGRQDAGAARANARSSPTSGTTIRAGCATTRRQGSRRSSR